MSLTNLSAHAERILGSRWRLVIGVAVVLLCIICAEAFALAGAGGKTIQSAAGRLVEKCGGAAYPPTCYDEEIPRLMEEITMEDAFEVTREIQSLDRSYQYCHVLGHKLAAKETAKDPSLWKEVIGRCPSGLCSNGCVHGAFQERFRKESLTDEELERYKPEFSEVCESREGFRPTGLESATCYHALGHLFMYVTDADVDKSLSLCAELAVKGTRDYSQLCFDGAFMQIFQPLEPDDFSLIEGKEVSKEEAKGFCWKYSGAERGSCWSESWPLFREQITTSDGLVSHCSILSPYAESERCFNALMYVVTAQSGFDEGRLDSLCRGMPAAKQPSCYAHAASRMIETDYRNGPQAVALCERGAPLDPQNICYRELLKYSTYNFHKDSPAFFAFCESLPGEWKEQCLNR